MVFQPEKVLLKLNFSPTNARPMKHFFTLLLSIAFLSSAVAQTMNQVVVSFSHQAGTDPLVVNQTEFAIWNGKKVKLSRAEFYISEMEIHHADETKMSIADQYLLVNAKNPEAEFNLGTWNVDAAHGMTLHIGVPESVNHDDPAAWPADHPLAPQNPSMHWGWSSGYRFMAIEGKVDNNGDGVPESIFEYHNLFDSLYRMVELTGIQQAANGVLHLHFTLDYVQLFENMSMTGNLYQHGSKAPNVAMMNNAATEDFISLATVSSSHEVQANALNIKAAPNPANSETWVSYDLPVTGSLQLTLGNMAGQTILNITGLPASGTTRLETATLPDGIYQYSFFENGKLLASKQLIVKH